MKKLEELIDFTEESKKNFEIYSQVRSKELYYLIAEFLYKKSKEKSLEFILNKNKKIDYYLVNYVVKLDKRIKNCLYVFLSTFEEFIKTQYINNYECIEGENCFKFVKKDNFNKLNLEMKEFLENWYILSKKSNSKCSENSFKNISYSELKKNILKFTADFAYIDHYDFTPNKNKSIEEIKNDLIEINDLRNAVMHHSIFVTDDFDKKIKMINTLYNELICDWDESFKDKLEKCFEDSFEKFGSKHEISEKEIEKIKIILKGNGWTKVWIKK